MDAASELHEWYASGRDLTAPRDTSPVAPPAWLAYALRFCRDGADGLARYFKAVPESHVVDGGVRCVCGLEVPVPDRGFAECSAGCRWFVRDGETVWAARLPVDS